MVASSSPAVPPYRVTLFFGPEVRDTDPDMVYCVFNVKKRSWKGGVQLTVEMAQDQIARCTQILQLESWLRTALHHLPREEYDGYVQRGLTLSLQYLCRAKLQLAINDGLKQDTTLLSPDMLFHALEQAVCRDGPLLKANLLAELDAPPPEAVAGENVAGRSMGTLDGKGVPVHGGSAAASIRSWHHAGPDAPSCRPVDHRSQERRSTHETM